MAVAKKSESSEEDEPAEPRGRTVEIAPWWYDRAKAEIAHRKIDQRQVTRGIMAGLGVRGDDEGLVKRYETYVSKCLNGKLPRIDLLDAISEFLDIPKPIVIPKTEAEALAQQGGDGAPTPSDPPAVVIRKNLVRFREEAGYDQIIAADATDIPYETLLRYETGQEEPPGSALVALARAYGRSLGDFEKLEPPPANVDDVPWIHFRFRPPFQPTDQDVAELQEVVRRISQRYRAVKRAHVQTFRQAKETRRAKGTKPPPK